MSRPPGGDPMSPARRRVLLFTQDLCVWGAQRQLVELAKGLDPRRYDVRLGTLVAGGPLVAEIEGAGIPVACFPRQWRWDLSPIFRLRDYLRRERIDILHSFLFLPNFYARFAGRLAQTPAVVSSLRSTAIEGWPRYAADIATCFLCDALIANSQAGRDHYVRRGGLPSRIFVVRNGLSPQRTATTEAGSHLRGEWGLNRFRTLVGMVAALEWRKDHRLLLHAMKEVVRVSPETGLVLAGDGSRRRSLQELAAYLGIAAHVVFLGTLPQPELLYPLLDVYVQASFHGEGISNATLEAMAHSLPVVATDVGGNRELVRDGETGHIVPARDASALARAILSLGCDPARRRAMGRAAYRRARTQFSLQTMLAATERVYDQLLPPIEAAGPAPARPACDPLPAPMDPQIARSNAAHG